MQEQKKREAVHTQTPGPSVPSCKSLRFHGGSEPSASHSVGTESQRGSSHH